MFLYLVSRFVPSFIHPLIPVASLLSVCCPPPPYNPLTPNLTLPQTHQLEPFIVEPFGLLQRRAKRAVRRTKKTLLLVGAALALGFTTGGGLRGGLSLVARAASSRGPAPAPMGGGRGGTSASLAVAVGPGLVMERPAVVATSAASVRPGAVAGVMGRGAVKEAGVVEGKEKTVGAVGCWGVFLRVGV